MTLSYETAANAAVVLNYTNAGGTSQTVVAGLNSLKPPGASRSLIEVKEFRQISRQFTGSASRTNLDFSGNAVFNDTGQLALKTLFDNNTPFGPVGHSNGECRIYLNKSTSTNHFLDSDFIALDTANDSQAIYHVVNHDFEAADVDGIYPYTGGLAVGGLVAFMTTHYTADTIAFADTDPDTITDSASGFVTAGFEAGQTLIVEGTSNNDGIYIINTVAAGTITLTAAAELTAESAGSSFTLHGGK